MKKKTRLDLYLSASAFALELLDDNDPLSLDSKTSERAKSEGIDAADYTSWKGYFAQCRNTYRPMAGQPAPSASRPEPKPVAPVV